MSHERKDARMLSPRHVERTVARNTKIGERVRRNDLEWGDRPVPWIRHRAAVGVKEVRSAAERAQGIVLERVVPRTPGSESENVFTGGNDEMDPPAGKHHPVSWSNRHQ